MTGALTTSGGTFNGPGTVTVANGATWETTSSGATVNGGSVINNGAATVDAVRDS